MAKHRKALILAALAWGLSFCVPTQAGATTLLERYHQCLDNCRNVRPPTPDWRRQCEQGCQERYMTSHVQLPGPNVTNQQPIPKPKIGPGPVEH